MDLIKAFNLNYEHGGNTHFKEKIVTGSFRQMFNTWLYYLNSDFKEGNNIKFFEYLNNRFPLPKYYRFDGLGKGDYRFDLRKFYYISPFREWKQMFFEPYEGYFENPHFNRVWCFYDALNRAVFPSIFDYLFNIWIEEIDNISYRYYNYYVYLEKYKKVNFLQYLIMKLRGQIV